MPRGRFSRNTDGIRTNEVRDKINKRDSRVCARALWDIFFSAPGRVHCIIAATTLRNGMRRSGSLFTRASA